MKVNKKIVVSLLSITIVVLLLLGGGLFYLKQKYGVDEITGSNVKIFTNEDDFEAFKEEQEQNGQHILMDDE